MLLGEPFYLNMMINLTKQFGSAAGVFLYQSGLGIGEEMGKLVNSAPDHLFGLENLFKNIYSAGWGARACELEHKDLALLESKKPLSILETNGFYSYLVEKDNLEHLAPFVNGVLTGIFDAIRRTHHTCEIEVVKKEPLTYRYTIKPL